MRNQVETQKERSQGTSIQHNSMHYLPRRGSEKTTLRTSCSKYNSITFYGSPGMPNQEQTQKNGLQCIKILCIICLEGGLGTLTIRKCCSKSKSINFYGSHGMRNQVERQQERTQWTSMHYFHWGRGGGLRSMTLGKRCSKSNSIMLYESTEMRNQVETQKQRSQWISIHQCSMHYLPRGGI